MESSMATEKPVALSKSELDAVTSCIQLLGSSKDADQWNALWPEVTFSLGEVRTRFARNIVKVSGKIMLHVEHDFDPATFWTLRQVAVEFREARRAAE